MSRDFEGLWAVVTGAGSGIGLETARQLSAQGAHVVHVDLTRGSLVDSDVFIECDISSEDSVREAVELYRDVSEGYLDVLINNAGIGAHRTSGVEHTC